jgi:hypothetical protein
MSLVVFLNRASNLAVPLRGVRTPKLERSLVRAQQRPLGVLPRQLVLDSGATRGAHTRA